MNFQLWNARSSERKPRRGRWACCSLHTDFHRHSMISLRQPKRGYLTMLNVLQPLHEMPLLQLTAPFIAGLRDKLASQLGRRIANFIMAVVSVACEYGKEQGIIAQNPVKGVKRVRRERGLPKAESAMDKGRMPRRVRASSWSARVAGGVGYVHGLAAGGRFDPAKERAPEWTDLACDRQDRAGGLATGSSWLGAIILKPRRITMRSR